MSWILSYAVNIKYSFVILLWYWFFGLEFGVAALDRFLRPMNDPNRHLLGLAGWVESLYKPCDTRSRFPALRFSGFPTSELKQIERIVTFEVLPHKECGKSTVCDFTKLIADFDFRRKGGSKLIKRIVYRPTMPFGCMYVYIIFWGLGHSSDKSNYNMLE